MTFNSNFGQNRQGPQTDLREWMLNQQRQFQEFDDSFGMPSAFGSSFGSLRDPFDSFFSSPFEARGGFPSLSFTPLASHRARGSLMAPQGLGGGHELSFPVSTPPSMLQRNNTYNTRSKVSFNGKTFEVALNVEDFKPEEIYVKTEGTTLSVSARHEEAGRCQQFEEKFSLPPGVSAEKMNSALSSTGVLTISAPCDSPAQLQLQHQTPGSQPSVVCDDEKLSIEMDVKDYRPESLDVKVEGEELIVTASQEVEGERSRVLQQRFTLPSGVRPEQVTSSLTLDGLLLITATREQEEQDKVGQREIQEAGGDKRGLEQEIETSGGGGGRWRVFCEGDQYKILVNLGGVNPEDLRIKTVADSVVVEVRQEEGRDGSKRRFTQSFKLPNNISPDTVTSTLSAEGILTISAPLPGN